MSKDPVAHRHLRDDLQLAQTGDSRPAVPNSLEWCPVRVPGDVTHAPTPPPAPSLRFPCPGILHTSPGSCWDKRRESEPSLPPVTGVGGGHRQPGCLQGGGHSYIQTVDGFHQGPYRTTGCSRPRALCHSAACPTPIRPAARDQHRCRHQS